MTISFQYLAKLLQRKAPGGYSESCAQKLRVSLVPLSMFVSEKKISKNRQESFTKDTLSKCFVPSKGESVPRTWLASRSPVWSRIVNHCQLNYLANKPSDLILLNLKQDIGGVFRPSLLGHLIRQAAQNFLFKDLHPVHQTTQMFSIGRHRDGACTHCCSIKN